MIKYFVSKEFLVTIIVFIGLLKWFGADMLSTYIQDSQVFAWSYIIYRLHKHHKLIKELLEGDDE